MWLTFDSKASSFSQCGCAQPTVPSRCNERVRSVLPLTSTTQTLTQKPSLSTPSKKYKRSFPIKNVCARDGLHKSSHVMIPCRIACGLLNKYLHRNWISGVIRSLASHPSGYPSVMCLSSESCSTTTGTQQHTACLQGTVVHTLGPAAEGCRHRVETPKLVMYWQQEEALSIRTASHALVHFFIIVGYACRCAAIKRHVVLSRPAALSAVESCTAPARAISQITQVGFGTLKLHTVDNCQCLLEYSDTPVTCNLLDSHLLEAAVVEGINFVLVAFQLVVPAPHTDKHAHCVEGVEEKTQQHTAR